MHDGTRQAASLRALAGTVSASRLLGPRRQLGPGPGILPLTAGPASVERHASDPPCASSYSASASGRRPARPRSDRAAGVQ